MKKIVKLVLATLLVTSLTACTSNEKPEEQKSKKLVVYTPESESIVNLVIPAFEEKYGITVEPVTANTGELIKRIDTEKNNPYGDVLLGGSASLLSANIELFEAYESPELKNMEMVSTENRMTFWKADGSVLLVNTDLVGDIEINGYEDLLNPKLKGQIAIGDAANSSSAFAHLENILKDMSPNNANESEEAWDFVKRLIENAEGKILSSSGSVHKGAAQGEYIVALTWEDPAATYVKDGGHVKVVHMKEGVIFNPSTVSIIKGGANQENAQLFIDFVLSQEIQDRMGSELCTRPLRKEAKLGSHLVPYNDINVMEADSAWSNENKKRLGERFTQIVVEAAK